MQPSLSIVSNDDSFVAPSNEPGEPQSSTPPFDGAPLSYPAASPPLAAAAPPPARRKGLGAFAVVLISTITSLIVGSVAGLGGYLVGQEVDSVSSNGQSQVQVQSLVQSSAESPERAPDSIAGIVSSVLPSVVSIIAEGKTDAGSGSGFVLRSDGYILTNNHVVSLVKDDGDITVVFSNGDEVPGKVVGTNVSYDLAVVKVDRTGLPAFALGNSKAVKVGDAVIAIGAPLGLEGTVTSGIVSAVDRVVTAGGSDDLSYINAIQTDAAINPGNSGGPLLDAQGRVIGINSAIASLAANGEPGNIGLGFAIPVNSAKRIAEELIATGASTTPAIGVSLDTSYQERGAKVREVTSGGPSEAAGIKVGDVITSIGDRLINDATELVVAIRSYAPGDRIKVRFERGGKDTTVEVTLGKLPSQD
jgi:putative serine protease PepD